MSNQTTLRELKTYVDLGGTAHWRESLKARYPEDHRIDAAVESLKRLDCELPKYEGTPLHHKIADLCDRIDASCDIISEKLRSIGFGYHPDSAVQVLESVVEALEYVLTSANKEDEIYIARLKESRSKAMVAEVEEGFECGALWAKDEAEWPELCAVVALEDLGDAADFYSLSNALSDFGVDSDYVLTQFGEQMPPNEKVMGFIKGAAKIKNQVEAAI